MSNEMTILYPDFIKAVSEIKRRRDKAIAENRGGGIFCNVPSGGGKTHLIEFLHRQWPADHTGEKSNIPIVSFTVPSSPTENSMAEALLKSIGDPAWYIGKAQSKTDRAIKLIQQCNVSVICIDNVQDIIERRGKKGITLIGSWIRQVYDRSKRLVVLLGTPAAIPVIDDNDQIKRRFHSRIRICHLGIENSESIAVFYRFLETLDHSLPIAELSGLQNQELIYKLFWATHGIQDYIFKLMSEAISHAVHEKREKILEKDLEVAFHRIFMDQAEEINPFSISGLSRPLDQEGEPFYKWY